MKPRMRSTRLPAAAFVACAVAFVPIMTAAARESLGIFSNWGAFRDGGAASRCFAIAEPVRRDDKARWRAALSVGFWPARGVRGQLHVRLSHRKQRGTAVILAVGEQRFPLIAGGSDAWARDPRADTAIVAALRSGTSATIEARAADSRPFVDAYALRGAATAIDAAALGCAKS